MYANNVLTSVNIDEENLAESDIRDDGCGCCMSEIKPHKIITLETALNDMQKMVKKAEKILEERKKLFEEVGSSLSRSTKKKLDPECRRCGKTMSAVLRNNFYHVKEEILCKECLVEEEGLYRDRGTVYQKVKEN